MPLWLHFSPSVQSLSVDVTAVTHSRLPPHAIPTQQEPAECLFQLKETSLSLNMATYNLCSQHYILLTDRLLLFHLYLHCFYFRLFVLLLG